MSDLLPPAPKAFAGGMTRSTTFVETTGRPSAAFNPKAGLALTRRITFDDRVHGPKGASTVRFAKSDIFMRRHFNATPRSRSSSVDEHEYEELLTPAGTRVIPPREQAVIVVDPLSTGAVVAKDVIDRGFKCICVWSSQLDGLADMVPEGMELIFSATYQIDTKIEYEQALERAVAHLNALPWPILAVIAGCETGVELSDSLSARLNVRSNGEEGCEARRNKYLMGEKVRASGTRAVMQKLATRWEEIQSFLQGEMAPMLQDNYRVIVKPIESAGSDDVTLCRSEDAVRAAFGNIMGKVNGLGLVNEAVLVQEYLEGIEYVVDTVSRDGVHKLAAVWEYDRGAANGASFVLSGQKPLDCTSELCQRLFAYMSRVLDALGVQHGPAHAEVKMCRGEPVLVEVGSRAQGAEGAWCAIADRVIGYNQATRAVDVYVNEQAFAAMPSYPPRLLTAGRLVFFVSYVEGVIQRINFLDEIKALPSFAGMNLHKKVGDRVKKTIDCFTWAGSLSLVHESEDQVVADYARIRWMEQNGLFEVAPPPAAEQRPELGAIVVVDPFSTGAVIAQKVMQAGYRVVCMYSDKLENIADLAGLIPEGLEFTLDAVLEFPDESETEGGLPVCLDRAEAAVRALPWPVVAVIPGAETGVEISDRLSERLGLRTNGAEGTEARRNKYLMGERVRAAGVRAVMQARVTDWAAAETFLAELRPEPFRVIVKPLDSAGSDDVTLCRSPEDVRAAIGRIMGKINGLGLLNEAVLVQEFLEGTEYVVDTVSLDGEHKVIGLWEYDRHAANGASFVLSGHKLLDASTSDVAARVFAYQRQVLDALGIRHGPAHAEVKMCRGEPVLVEVGARCQGAEGCWCIVADEAVGYNQATLAVDVYIRPERFAPIPAEPRLQKFGRIAFIVSYVEGTLAEINQTYMNEIKAMGSFRGISLHGIKIGAPIKKTVDCFTFAGSIQMVNADEAALIADYARIREMEKTGLFVVEQAASS